MVQLVLSSADVTNTAVLHARTSGTSKYLENVQYREIDERTLGAVIYLSALDDDW